MFCIWKGSICGTYQNKCHRYSTSYTVNLGSDLKGSKMRSNAMQMILYYPNICAADLSFLDMYEEKISPCFRLN